MFCHVDFFVAKRHLHVSLHCKKMKMFVLPKFFVCFANAKVSFADGSTLVGLWYVGPNRT